VLHVLEHLLEKGVTLQLPVCHYLWYVPHSFHHHSQLGDHLSWPRLFVVSFSYPMQIPRYLKLDYNHFFPRPFQFTDHELSCDLMLYNHSYSKHHEINQEYNTSNLMSNSSSPICHMCIMFQGFHFTIKSNDAPSSQSGGLHWFLFLHPPCHQCRHHVPWQEQCPLA
jgi:hypothetical protein